ncbi:MerR family transcriptional regulator [Paenarthrobacter nitroguajacolicus]|uniref:MerR family transcriptional regulator n=1 Tax=Paenarthrobacter nitroguajacolicus TaxID=211146 RepID=UPI0028629B1F|nr:MerR family transcriptional regulator [Paenarthrobacter nitroguajacolicus]MDR6638430.1 DNA-binding transcriptional MerR regulator [Paenarthrobacter nitroguajacolicus]
MRIGELAAATGVSVRSLRYYENQGFLNPERSASGQRIYAPDALQRVTLIQRLFDAGLCSKAMTDILPLITDPRPQAAALQARLMQERERLSNDIAKIKRNRESLDHMIGELRQFST